MLFAVLFVAAILWLTTQTNASGFSDTLSTGGGGSSDVGGGAPSGNDVLGSSDLGQQGSFLDSALADFQGGMQGFASSAPGGSGAGGSDDATIDSLLQALPLSGGGYSLPVIGGKPSPYVGDDGLDIHTPVGSPVMSISDGTVVYSDPSGHTLEEGPGNTTGAVRIANTDGTQAVYFHLSSLAGLAPGQQVSAGQVVGASGIANGVPHVHVGLYQGPGGDGGNSMTNLVGGSNTPFAVKGLLYGTGQ